MKVGDRVIIIGGWVYNMYGLMSGTISSIFPISEVVIIVTPDFVVDGRSVLGVGPDDIVLEKLYNSKLYNSLK